MNGPKGISKPNESTADRVLVQRAKERLMEWLRLDESAAYHTIRVLAQRERCRKVQVSGRILNARSIGEVNQIVEDGR